MALTARVDLYKRLDSLKNKLSESKEEVKVLTEQIKALEQTIKLVDGIDKPNKAKKLFKLGELKRLVIDKITEGYETAREITDYILKYKELDNSKNRKVYMTVSNTLAKLKTEGYLQISHTDDKARVHYKLSSLPSLTTNNQKNTLDHNNSDLGLD